VAELVSRGRKSSRRFHLLFTLRSGRESNLCNKSERQGILPNQYYVQQFPTRCGGGRRGERPTKSFFLVSCSFSASRALFSSLARSLILRVISSTCALSPPRRRGEAFFNYTNFPPSFVDSQQFVTELSFRSFVFLFPFDHVRRASSSVDNFAASSGLAIAGLALTC
jgi:hypothetical protein